MVLCDLIFRDEDPVGDWTIRVFTSDSNPKPIHFLNWYLTIFGEASPTDIAPPITIVPLPEQPKTDNEITSTLVSTAEATGTSSIPPPLETGESSTAKEIVENLIGGNVSLIFFAVVGFLGAIGFVFFVCRKRRQSANTRNAYSFKELQEESDVFGGEYEGDNDVYFTHEDEDAIMLNEMDPPSV